MKITVAFQMASLLLISTSSVAATVKYQDTNLTIVARQEPLDAVLKSLGREMRIYVTIPRGLNPMVNCEIQQQPIQQALKTLLGDMSYSLNWEDKTGRLVGVTILPGSDRAANEVQLEGEREEGEVRMVQEIEAQEEALQQDAERHDAETAAYLKSVGLEPPW